MFNTFFFFRIVCYSFCHPDHGMPLPPSPYFEVHIAAVKFAKEASLAARLDALILEYLLPNAKRNTFYRKILEKEKKAGVSNRLIN